MITGPAIARLTRRLLETPPAFLAEPAGCGDGKLVTAALAGDTVRACGKIPDILWLQRFDGQPDRRNWLRCIAIACWLLHDSELLVKEAQRARRIADWLAEGLQPAAGLVRAERFVSDEDRREELARLCLQALDLLPAGEEAAQAQDRLQTLSSTERSRIETDARAVRERARLAREAARAKAIEEEMARRAAEEAAAPKTGRD